MGLTFVCGPIYILSRWLNVLFPLTFVIILAVDGINLFDEVDIFQVIMLIIWFGLGIDILMEDKYLWMFLPSTDNMKGIEDQTECDKVGRLIEETYFEMTLYPIIQTVVIDRFGNDIACVILYYFENIHLENEDCEMSTKNLDTLQIPL